MSYELPALPYSYDALEPYISKETLRIHHAVLQKRYVDNLNALMGNIHVSLEQLIIETPKGSLLDNAQQVFNHTFLWHSMSTNGGGFPSRQTGLGQAMLQWGNVFQTEFMRLATTLFGSGYLWLVADEKGDVLFWPAQNANNPMRLGFTPLLTLDLWEHSYFLDYKAKRANYVQAFLNHLINWRFAERNYANLFGR